MRHLNIVSILVLVIFFHSMEAQHNAIFNGGNNDGYTTDRQASAQNNNIFSGGFNDGYHSRRSATPTGNAIFNGGINDGYSIDRVATTNNNSIFYGGINDGYAKSGVPLATNNGIFSGGINDGYARRGASTDENNGIYTGGINDGYAVDRSSEIIADPNLPIELVYFDAFRDGEDVLTQWETASEFNNDYFTVEKMKEAGHITDVGALPSQGNGPGNRFYELLDADPFEGTSYYRLRQTDLDGTETWSEWVAVRFDYDVSDNIEFTIQPNPVYGEAFDIVVTGLRDSENLEIRIYDMRGILVHRENAITDPVTRLRKRIDPKVDLAGGMYVVEISGKSYRLNRKLLVVR